MRRLMRAVRWGCVLCVVVAAGCDRGEQAPPAPPFAGPIDQAPRAAVLDYARSQRYVQVSGDSQRLMLGAFPNAQYGPRAHIDPVAGGYKQGDSASLGRGRLLARVINVDTIPYPKLGLGPQDTVYFFVDGSGGRLRSVLIASRADSRPVIKGFVRESHPEYGKGFKWRQAEARFLWRDTDEQLWVACDVWDCCRTDELLQ